LGSDGKNGGGERGQKAKSMKGSSTKKEQDTTKIVWVRGRGRNTEITEELDHSKRKYTTMRGRNRSATTKKKRSGA